MISTSSSYGLRWSSTSSLSRILSRVSLQRRNQTLEGRKQVLSSINITKQDYWNYNGYSGRWQSQNEFHTIASTNLLTDNKDKEREKNRPSSKLLVTLPFVRRTPLSSSALYHTSTHNDKAVAIILGLGAISASAYAAASAVKAWNEYKTSIPDEPEKEQTQEEETTTANNNTHQATDASNEQQVNEEQKQGSAKSSSDTTGKRENIFKQWFGVDVGTKYYEGGFEETMTRREAALILGVRETSTTKRIKEAHRKLLVLNHPDTGGSTYLSGKINEAKELLLKGRQM
jgi:DnaJ homolog subfamily C member 19